MTPFEKVAGPFTFTEGPVWDGGRVLFTDMHASRIMAYDPSTGHTEVLFTDTEMANGLALDAAGRLYACQDRGRRVSRYHADGTWDVVAETFEGRRLNSPNDLVVAPDGSVWFTDPRYGDERGDMELDHESVYCAIPGDGTYGLARKTFDTTRPNGLALSPDQTTLYVAESPRAPTGVRQLRAYPIEPSGHLAPPDVLYDFGPHRGADGMCVLLTGVVVVACGWERSGPGPRLLLIHPDGTVIDEIRTPTDPTNVCLGGSDHRDLYLTAYDGCLWRFPEFVSPAVTSIGRPAP